MGKFFFLCRDIIGIEVYLSLESLTTIENKICRLRLLVPGNDLIATGRHKTFEQAIIESAAGLEKQLEKRKKRVKDAKQVTKKTRGDSFCAKQLQDR